MLRPRIIPVLLIRRDGLVKTVKFADGKYVGDPLNAVRIFNEMRVDEIVVLDIDATVEERDPNFDRIAKLAEECRMPLCYGGGVNSVEDAKKIIGLGVEKVALGSVCFDAPDIVAERYPLLSSYHFLVSTKQVIMSISTSFIVLPS